MAYSKSSKSRSTPKRKFYGRKKSKWGKATPATQEASAILNAVSKSKVCATARYPRTLEEWLLRDDKLLADGIQAGFDLADLSAMLDREPVSVIDRLDAVGTFPCELDSEERIELLAMTLSGVPIKGALNWCLGADDRLHWTELDNLRKLPDPKAGIEMAMNSGFWKLTSDDLDDLYWLGEQDAAAVAGAVASLLEKFDAPTPRSVRDSVTGRQPALVSKPARSRAASSDAFASVAPEPAPILSVPAAYTQRKTTSRGRGKSRSRGASVPSGAPIRGDTRTPSERAWENLTHW